MDDMTKCPHCGEEAKRRYYTGPGGVEEESITCKACGYWYEFAYGHYVEQIPGEEAMAWTHDNHVKVPCPSYSTR